MIVLVTSAAVGAAVAVSGILGFIGIWYPTWCDCWRAPTIASCCQQAR